MKIAVFQVGNKGEHKIEGIRKYGRGIELEVFTVPEPLPQIIDEPEDYIYEDFEADLILDYLYHGDLTDYLIEIANKKNIPIIASGRKKPGAITPSTCCSLGDIEGIEGYTHQFGLPEIEVEVDEGVVKKVKVKRGAPCGATWEAAEKIINMKVEKALTRFALEVQFICQARGFYEVKGKKAPLHIAGELHKEAIKRAVERLTSQ